MEYALIASILIIGTIYFTLKSEKFPDALRKAVITAFFTSGMFYAIYADTGWSQWMATDVKHYWGLSTEEKLEKMDGDIYKFAMQAKNKISDDYQIYTTNEYMYYRIQYYLLPLIKRNHAPYLVVIDDDEALYDANKRVLTRGQTVIPDVEPVCVFAKNAYVLKRR